MKITWTRHAEERQKEWQKRLGVTREEVGNWEADVLLFVLRDEPPEDAVEEPGGVIVSYGADGEPVSVEFLNACARQLIRPGETSVQVETASPR
jgi:hypothetical protein